MSFRTLGIHVELFLVRVKGLEPSRRRHQILSLARLPIPPYPHICKTKAVNNDGFIVVGVRGFEPPASWSRTKHSTKLSHTPMLFCNSVYYSIRGVFCQAF